MFFGQSPNPHPQKNNPSDPSGIERRKHKRIYKSFILNYFNKSNPEIKYEITQLKNISLGGMCFITSQQFPPGTIFGIELKTPYITDITYLEGEVQQSHEKMKNILYETRLKFTQLNPDAEFILRKLTELFENGKDI